MLSSLGMTSVCMCDEPTIDWGGDLCLHCQVEAALDAVRRLEGQYKRKRPRRNLRPLTVLQQATLDFIKSFIEEEGYAPSLREIVEGLGLRSTSESARLVGILERKGCIEREPFVARSIRLVEDNGRRSDRAERG